MPSTNPTKQRSPQTSTIPSMRQSLKNSLPQIPRGPKQSIQLQKTPQHKKSFISSSQKYTPEPREPQTLRQSHQQSININIKSTTKELIESKEYEPNLRADWTPVFPDFKQEDSQVLEQEDVESDLKKNKIYAKDVVHDQAYEKFINKANFMAKRAYSKQYGQDSQFLQLQQPSFLAMKQPFSPLQPTHTDIQKLSQLHYDQLLSKQSQQIKKLASTNNQLKATCKQIIALLRNDSVNQKRKNVDELIVKEIYKICLNYEKKKSLKSQKKG